MNCKLGGRLRLALESDFLKIGVPPFYLCRHFATTPFNPTPDEQPERCGIFAGPLILQLMGHVF
jgi:hypothetical protein